MAELRASRALAAAIPESGAALFDLLNKEPQLRVRALPSPAAGSMGWLAALF